MFFQNFCQIVIQFDSDHFSGLRGQRFCQYAQSRPHFNHRVRRRQFGGGGDLFQDIGVNQKILTQSLFGMQVMARQQSFSSCRNRFILH